MQVTRRAFIRGGVGAFTVTFAAPAFLSDLARAQGARARNLVVLYLSGGNDALSTVVPYLDPYYYSRRPALAIPAGTVLQSGSDSSGQALGLHPRLTGVLDIFRQGRLAIVQRTGYTNSSRSHFQGFDIWGTADPTSQLATGWLGRFLDTTSRTDNPLLVWNTRRDTPIALKSLTVPVPAIPDLQAYTLLSPNAGNHAIDERNTTTRLTARLAGDSPQVAFVNETVRGALDTLDRVASVASYRPTVTYPDTGFAASLQMVARAIVGGLGTRIFWVQTGGYDTHSRQGAAGGGAYADLTATLDDGVFAFYSDLRNHGLLNDTLILQFSEFGRRISENGNEGHQGTDHGAAGVMLAMGGAVRGGIYGTAASLNPTPDNPTLENNGADVRHETDFRAVYARVLDNWLGADSTTILRGDFRSQGPPIV